MGDVDWARETYSLTSAELTKVIGQPILFGFLVTTDFWLASQAWVDDTALAVTTSGVTPTPSSTPSTTPVPPTPTPTATSTPATCPAVVQDGGFEQATGDSSDPAWSVAGNARFTVGEAIARSGQNAAILGWTSAPATGDLWQIASIPSNAVSAALSFWYQTLGDGSFTVRVDVTDNAGNTVLVPLATMSGATSEWKEYSHAFTAGELSSIAGKNVRLRFHISDVADPEDVVIDDVSWTVCTGGSGTTPSPTATVPPQTGGPFRLTLAWSDYPGEPAAAAALVNDLDLEVVAPDGTHHYGNEGLYASGQCLRSGRWDACNNVEGVIVPNASYGTYTVIVHGYNVPQGPQPFALAASGDYLQEGGVPSSTPTPGPTPGQNAVYLPLVEK